LGESLLKSGALDASSIIKEQVSPLIHGSGGGQKSLATAGGQDITQLKKVIEEVKNRL
jgi:alanyl-tRNA synthetase